MAGRSSDMVYRVFRRPAIDLDAKRKSWAMRIPRELKVGDVVAGHGEIVDMQHEQTLEACVHIQFKNGETIYFNGD